MAVFKVGNKTQALILFFKHADVIELNKKSYWAEFEIAIYWILLINTKLKK